MLLNEREINNTHCHRRNIIIVMDVSDVCASFVTKSRALYLIVYNDVFEFKRKL